MANKESAVSQDVEMIKYHLDKRFEEFQSCIVDINDKLDRVTTGNTPIWTTSLAIGQVCFHSCLLIKVF